MRRKLKLISALVLTTAMMSPFVLANESFEDSKITSQIVTLIKQEKDLPLNSLEVSTHDGIVKLNGTLETMLQANRAVELAYSVQNVSDVDSNIEIKDSEQYIKDAIITGRARGKVMQMARHGQIAKTYNLHFETTNGNLHVLGNVGNKKDIITLKNELVKLKGVKEVKANVWVLK
jgi:osmotically-inducible protein OsmY